MRQNDWKRSWVDPSTLWNVELVKNLPYAREQFNDDAQNEVWIKQGHQPRTGALFDMRRPNQPSCTGLLIDWASHLEHVGISYYEMAPGDNLPYHSDTYKKYISIFNLWERQKRIWRYIFFVEDWKPGHIFEINGMPITQWRSGDYVAWRYDVPHMAANLGTENRYTIQLTGVEIAGI
jgi:hypothetical protein